MWDIIGKPEKEIGIGMDCQGNICEGPGGVAYNIAIGLSKGLGNFGFKLSLISAIGENEKSDLILKALVKNNIEIKDITVKGKKIDHYLSIETSNGEIFGSINSSNIFVGNQNNLKEKFLKICTTHKKNKNSAILIFDGNCSRDFLSFVKKEANDVLFTKYFVPANFDKLTEFWNEAKYFKGFNLIINLKEAKVLLGSENFSNSEDASKALFERTKFDAGLTIVTDGPNIACAVTKHELAKTQPQLINDSLSRLGAGDAFFTFFLSHKELNPFSSLEESLAYASSQTYNFLEANDQKDFRKE